MVDRVPHALPLETESGLPSSWPGLLLVSWLLVFSPLLDGGTTHAAVLVIRVTILCLLSVFLWQGIASKTIVLPSLAVGWPVVVYLALAALSTAASPYTHQSVQWLIVLFGYATLLYLLVSLIRTWNHVGLLLGLFVALGLFEAGLAMAQRHWFHVIRPSGTFFNPNFLAGYLAAACALVVGLLSYAPVPQRRQAAGRPTEEASRSRTRWVWMAAPALLLLFLPAVALTGSRGGMVALVAATGFIAAARFRWWGLAGLVLLVLLVGAVIPNPLRDRMQAEHEANPVTYARVDIWRSSMQQMVDHPLGVGLGLYQYVFPRYAFPVEGQIARYGKRAQSSHSEYLQMGSELGWLSLVIFGWGLALAAREAQRALRSDVTWWQRGLLAGLCGAALGTLVQAAVDSNLHEPAIAIVLVLAIAILLSAGRLLHGEEVPPRRIPVRSRALWAGPSVAVMAVLAFLVLRAGVAWMAFEEGGRALAGENVPGAIEAYGRSVELDPGVALYHSALAAAYFREFERTHALAPAEMAAREIQEAMALNPLDGRLAGLLGHVLASLAAAQPAIAPSEAAVAWRRAAVAAYSQAVRLDPYTPFNRFELGRLYMALGEREKAESIVRAAVELEPNFLPGREWLARLYLSEGHREAADVEYREIRERLQRYAHWVKDPVEERFLRADVTALAGALEERKSPT